MRLGLGWAKSQFFYTGQCPVIKYHRQLMMAILHEKVQVRGFVVLSFPVRVSVSEL